MFLHVAGKWISAASRLARFAAAAGVASIVCLGSGAAQAQAAKAPMPRPALSTADLQQVTKWIGQEVSNSRQQYCYRDSFGRGVGKPLSTCPAGLDKDGALCYPQCRSGYNGVGPVCWQNCPGGFRDDGAFCAKPAAYGRGGGYPWKGGDGLNDKGMFKRCEADHGSGRCEKDGAIVYPKCKPGFKKVGCCICSPECQGGMTDIGVSCAKQSYGRTAGTPMKCAAGEQEDAGLCYSPCNKPDFKGVGPVCWQNCPGGRKDCGAGCTTDTQTCVTDTVSMVTAPLVLAANIVSAGSASAGTKAASMAAKAPKVFDAMKKAAKVADLASTAADVVMLAKDVADTTATWVDDFVADWRNVTTERVQREVDARFKGDANTWVKRQYAMVHLTLLAQQNGIMTAQTALSAVAMFDPTGVAGVVDAFAKPICKADAPFPNVRVLY